MKKRLFTLLIVGMCTLNLLSCGNNKYETQVQETLDKNNSTPHQDTEDEYWIINKKNSQMSVVSNIVLALPLINAEEMAFNSLVDSGTLTVNGNIVGYVRDNLYTIYDEGYSDGEMTEYFIKNLDEFCDGTLCYTDGDNIDYYNPTNYEIDESENGMKTITLNCSMNQAEIVIEMQNNEIVSLCVYAERTVDDLLKQNSETTENEVNPSDIHTYVNCGDIVYQTEGVDSGDFGDVEIEEVYSERYVTIYSDGTYYYMFDYMNDTVTVAYIE